MSTPTEPILETEDIQGNVIPGFARNLQKLIGFRVDQPQVARRWLAKFSSTITTSEDILDYRNRYRGRYEEDDTPPIVQSRDRRAWTASAGADGRGGCLH